jgi:hypothetical protein
MDKTTNAIMATLFLSGVAPESEADTWAEKGEHAVLTGRGVGGAIPEIRALFARADMDVQASSTGWSGPPPARKAFC